MTAKDTSTTPLWLQVLHSAQRVETRFEDELSGVGLSISKLGVLRILVDEGQPMPLSRLAGKLSCVKSNVTQLVDRLEADGLVARINDPADRRSVLASITDAGRERFTAGIEAAGRADAALFGETSAEDRHRLEELFTRLCASGCQEQSVD